MKKFEFTRDYEGKKKGDIIEMDMGTYHGYIHPLIARKILKVIRDDLKVIKETKPKTGGK